MSERVQQTTRRPAKMCGLMRKQWDAQKGRCWLCGFSMRGWGSNHPLAASRDHVKPRGNGGYDKWKNYRLAHICCNVARDRMAPETFRSTIGDAVFQRVVMKIRES